MDAMVRMANVVPKVIRGEITGIKFDWWPEWGGQTIAIVASGPSAKKSNIKALEGKARVLAINESYNLCPWADALYACDPAWWKLRQGVREFHGLKIGCLPWPNPIPVDFDPFKMYPDVQPIIVERYRNDLLLNEQGRVGSGGNSGFQALNLAVQFGVRKILLVGYDMRVDLGEHWHKRHPYPLSNPHPNDNLPRWRAAVDGAVGVIREAGVNVFNCSQVSLLRSYPKMGIEEALECQ